MLLFYVSLVLQSSEISLTHVRRGFVFLSPEFLKQPGRGQGGRHRTQRHPQSAGTAERGGPGRLPSAPRTDPPGEAATPEGGGARTDPQTRLSTPTVTLPPGDRDQENPPWLKPSLGWAQPPGRGRNPARPRPRRKPGPGAPESSPAARSPWSVLGAAATKARGRRALPLRRLLSRLSSPAPRGSSSKGPGAYRKTEPLPSLLVHGPESDRAGLLGAW